MQVSIKWLKDYVDIDETAEEIADRLTMAGVPVEHIVRADKGLEKVITGRIEKITPHPDSDHLLVCQLNMGGDALLQIVTGAQNVREGNVVPVAMVGAVLPDGKKISKGKLRGVVSNGMMCSAGELAMDIEGLPDEQVHGIYILPPDTPVGIPAARVLGLDDVVLEFELTANRADCFSVIGIAREVAALTGRKLRMPSIEVQESAGGSRLHSHRRQGAVPPFLRACPARCEGRTHARMDGGSSARCGHPLDQQCRRRDELRHAGAGPTPPRIRLRSYRRTYADGAARTRRGAAPYAG